jgi:LacI family transcriptional regulator
VARMVDVAAAAGVSITTVSHVLNNTRPVRDEVRHRVLEAVEQTGYSPNMVARSLATRNSKVIAVVMSFLSNPFFGPLVSSIERTAQRQGYTLLLSDNHERESQERDQLRIMIDRQVDGVIMAPVSSEPSDVIDLLAERRVPTVFIDRFADHRFDDVGVENVEATAALVTHLAQCGHTRIAFVSGRSGLSTTAERLAGYRLGLERAGLNYDRTLVRSGGSRIEPAYRAVGTLLELPAAPTAIVPANNAMSVGVLRGLRDRGVSVPGDVAIAAFDDLALADLMSPALTAMAQPIAEMGDLAAKLLLRRIRGFDGPPERKVLPASFQHRDSCGCAGGRGTRR